MPADSGTQGSPRFAAVKGFRGSRDPIHLSLQSSTMPKRSRMARPVKDEDKIARFRASTLRRLPVLRDQGDQGSTEDQ